MFSSINCVLAESLAARVRRVLDWAGAMRTSECEELIRFEAAPSYREFFERCLLPNRPCILPRRLVEHWPVIQSRAWAAPSPTPEGPEAVSWEALKLHYGSQTAPVVVTRVSPDGGIEDDRTDMTIREAVDLVLTHRADASDASDARAIYIKDWHMVKQLQEENRTEEAPYAVPGVLADDWMNNIALGGDDFRFVYAGTAGSQTLLHRDVYTSYSWSTNVVGRKRWHLFPPRVIAHLRRFPAVETSAMVSDIETLQRLLNTPAERGKEYGELERAWEAVQVVEQAAGETIFVPSNWWHQVANVGECISINRNWCNAVNLPSLYASIETELDHVEESLCDVRDLLRSNHPQKDDTWKHEFYKIVQDVAVHDAGWAWDGFWKMVLRNLEDPPTEKQWRPDDFWVRDRVLPLTQAFEARQDAHWLESEILATARRCRDLLEGKQT